MTASMQQSMQRYNTGLRGLPILLVALLSLSFAIAVGGQEQYRSRVYVDIEQDATENVSLSVSELEAKLTTFHDAATRASAERFLAKQYAGNKDYSKAAQLIEDSLRRSEGSDASRRELLLQLAQLYLLQKTDDGEE